MTATETSAAESRASRRRVLQGKVVSDKMSKTITVRVERVKQHAKYRKYIRCHDQYHAHDEGEEARAGDVVEIVETRPLSKLKRWRLVSVVRRTALPEEADS